MNEAPASTTASKGGTEGLVAAVTVFKPDGPLLRLLLAELRACGLPVIVHIDGPEALGVDDPLRTHLSADKTVTVLQSDHNLGIGAALNRLAASALQAGHRRILYFDQDSGPSRELAAGLSKAFDRAEQSGMSVAAVGPRPVSPRGEATKPPRYRRRKAPLAVAGLTPVDFVITSGCLVSLRALAAVGPFREDYFIDAVDTEWCLRAWSLDHAVFVSGEWAMPHRIGHGVLRLGPIGFPRQSESRMATYFRNQAHGLRLPHVPWLWKLRTLVYLPLQACVFLTVGDRKPGSAGRLLRAVWAGLSGRLGKPS